MKRIALLLLMLTLLFPLCGSEFEQMLELEASGIQNADLYHNIGVGYWQTGQSGMANLYFLRALNLDSAHKQAKENLDYVQSLSPDKELYADHAFLQRVFLAGWAFMNLHRLAWLSLFSLLLVALSFIWLLYYNPAKEPDLPQLVLGLTLFFFLLCAGFLGSKAYNQRYSSKAVITQNRVELKAAPEANAPKVAIIHEALVIKVLKKREDWAWVKLPDGKKGWLQEDGFRTVRI